MNRDGQNPARTGEALIERILETDDLEEAKAAAKTLKKIRCKMPAFRAKLISVWFSIIIAHTIIPPEPKAATEALLRT